LEHAEAFVLPVKILPPEETGRPAGKIPRKAFADDAGFDLYPTIEAKLYPGERLLVPTGVSVAIPSGYYGRIAERSGYGSKGLGVGAGVIDSGYRGEILVALYNRRVASTGHDVDREPIVISPDAAVAQLIIEKCDPFAVVLVDELPDADRAESGFGSSDGRSGS
jgi:dUTP pyrophosphatase